MKKRLIYSAAIACGVATAALMVCWKSSADKPDPTAMEAWKAFGNHVHSGELPNAYNMLTSAEQKRWSFQRFTNSAIIAASPGLLDLTVTRYHTHHLSDKTTFLAGGETLTIPHWLEDGFMVAEVTMRKQNGEWKLEIPMVHAR